MQQWKSKDGAQGTDLQVAGLVVPRKLQDKSIPEEETPSHFHVVTDIFSCVLKWRQKVGETAFKNTSMWKTV